MKFRGYFLQITGLSMLLTGAWWVLQGTGMIGDPANSHIAGRKNWAAFGAAIFALGGICLSLSRRNSD